MLFCPTCGNMLHIRRANLGVSSRFCCVTCPYVYPVEREISIKQKLHKKKVEHIFNREEAMKSATKMQVTCPYCGHGEAYVRTMQIRSADEPETVFYTCCSASCGRTVQLRD